MPSSATLQSVEDDDPRQAILEEQLAEFPLPDELLHGGDAGRRGPGLDDGCFATVNAVLLRLVDIPAVDSGRAVLAHRPHRGNDRRHAVFGVGDPAFGVPDSDRPVLALAVHPPGLDGRIGRQRLIVNAHEVEDRQERVCAVAEELVAGVRRGACAADQHLHAGLFAGLEHGLGHVQVDFAEAEAIGPPAGDRDAFPGFVPEFDGVDRPFRPTVLDQHFLEILFELLIERGEPRQVFLRTVDHGAVVAEPGAATAQRLLLARRAAASHGQHQRHVILHGPIDVRFPDRAIPALGAGPFDPQPLEESKDLDAHFMRPRQIEGVGRKLDPPRISRRHSDARRRKRLSPTAQVQHQPVGPECGGDCRRHPHQARTFGGQVHRNRGIRQVGDLENPRVPNVAGPPTSAVVDHMDFCGPPNRVAAVLDAEGERRLIAGPKHVGRHAARSFKHLPVLGLCPFQPEHHGEVLHSLAGNHLGERGGRREQGQRKQAGCNTWPMAGDKPCSASHAVFSLWCHADCGC